MSTPPPPAVKKRGRPAKKPTADDTKTNAPADAKPTARSAPPKPTAVKEKDKKAPARPAKPPATVRQPATPIPDAAQTPIPEAAKSTVPAPATPAAESAPNPAPPPPTAEAGVSPTPASPATSKILAQVRATGTLKATPPPAQPQTPALPKNAPTQAKQPFLRPAHNTTTIPLPRAPLHAPSPKQPPAIPAAAARAPTAPAAWRPRGRIIEPMPDLRLPPKYKPAARRVTAIIVGVPIILVFGWELYGRWRGKVQRKFVERPGGE